MNDSDSWADIDMSNQIDNSWNKDSVLAIKKKESNFTIKIRSEDKKSIKREFIWEVDSKRSLRHNRKVITITYCFMLYKLLKLTHGFSSRIKICNDVAPKVFVNNYLTAICRYYNEEPIQNRIKIRFRKEGEPDSSAHGIARKVFKGRRKEDYLIRYEDLEELRKILKKIT